MSKVAILGAGAWGTAIAVTLARGGGTVTLAVRRTALLETMRASGENAAYLPGIALPATLEVTDDWSAAVRDADNGPAFIEWVRRELGIPTAAIYSDADRTSSHVRMADEAERLGPAPSAESYLCIDRILDAARRHAAHHGDLPTVTQLMDLADVSRGTAGTALQELREQPAQLHIITENTNARTQP